MSDLDTLAKQADAYAAARTVLAERVTALNDGMALLRRQHIAGIKRALARTAEAESLLRGLVQANASAFTKPRTRVFSGVKVGYQKGKGVLHIPDAAVLIARIKKHFPEQADLLIDTTEKPAKAALTLLPGADLKKLGASITDAGDQIVIKPVDGEVDKLVEALLKNAADGDDDGQAPEVS